MTKINHWQFTLFSVLMIGAALFATDALAQATSGGVQFSKIDTLGNSFINWIKGNPTTIFFTLALIITGFLAAFNRISWMWVGMICLGAFFAFGAPAIVTQLKAIFT
ncbi:TrbC/VirB2 family protein [Paracoccus pantotrophus]|uniref:TrbC/VirB2 family protein n=1 Tax=Paracoccus pantotrophus TaxID=82367 RepID=UPI0008EE4D53|nr:TrbC/VirB2 family protein [Paracoccus pantotrophus]MDF3855620.1 TrbC/VirB2 family protein [Paracoccus pantotrophus]SFP05429.1 TrbC/VIRB2 family protein [Paracoccus pantotrophus]